MAWTTSLNDLRNLLADNAQNRFCYRKKIFGTIDGTNKAFKSFEPRRTTDFHTSGGEIAPLGVYVNGVIQSAGAIASDDLISGEFIFVTAPPALTAGKPTVLTASYYYQWFLDGELNGFLANASQWLQQSSDISQTPSPLIPPTLHYAASDALRFASMRWAERASTAFLLEDAPKKEALGLSGTYMKLADNYAKRATELRDDYYKRSGQALAPTFQSSWGVVSPVTPRR